MTATLANMPSKSIGILETFIRGTLFLISEIMSFGFPVVGDEVFVPSATNYVNHTEIKTTFKDKKEAIEAFKEFLKEKVNYTLILFRCKFF